MIGASKILTVSYGTFSCTLEGFDDSFGTMKAIAEYFRDLAADDRYFGAEPPTPDAEMLAKIAGREIKRQVEAKIDDNGVVLRPLTQTVEVAAPVEPAPKPQPTLEAVAPAPAPIIEETPVVEEIAEETTEETPAPLVARAIEYDDAQAELATDETDAATESVAAKLRRIRAVVAKNQAAGTAAPIFAEDQHAEEFLPEVEAEDEVDEAVVDTDTKEDTDLDTPVDEIADVVLDEEEAQADDIEVEAEMEVEAEADVEIEAEAETIVEDEFEEEYEAEDGDDAVSSILDAVSEDDAIEEVAEDDADDLAEQDEAADNIFDAINDDVSVEEVEEVIVADEDEEVTAEHGDDTEADILEAATDEISVAETEDDIEDISDENIDEDTIEPVAEEISADADEEDSPQESVRTVQPTRARIIKMKRTDNEADADDSHGDSAQDANDVADTPDEDHVQEDVQDTLGETSLSAEDEADLVAELADVELEDTPELDRGIDTVLRTERASRALRNEGGGEDEAAVSRLLDETNAKLDSTESTRRRSAISHLRAAVAATVADRKFNPLKRKDTPDDADAYRTDLADAVHPQRPEASDDDHTDRPAPLILVSEQRIAKSDPAPIEQPAVIRPRRVAKGVAALREVETGQPDTGSSNDDNSNADKDDANILADSTSFADFAEKMGATELPDLLEAAAAYTAYVEGRPHFARPQIMRQVASFAGKGEFNREEGLRSFGQLLRQGKILKVKRGQFEIADSTRFKPEERIAGE